MVDVRRWTKAAKECYNRQCRCAGCPVQENMETRCRMKVSVIELVRVFGKPEEGKHEYKR